MKSVRILAATATFASVSLLSCGWSTQAGLSLSVYSAQAAPRHVAMHRHYRHRYSPNPVAAGADLAAGAVGAAGAMTAGAVGTAAAIASAPFGGPYPYYGGGYYASSTWGDYECRWGSPGCRPYAERWAQSGPTWHGGGRDISRPGGRGVSRKPAE